LKILLDTNIWLWWLNDDQRLPKLAKALIIDPENEIFVSSISIWEIAIKSQLEKLTISRPISEFASNPSVVYLDFTAEHAVGVGSLPMHHRDPFDRALLAQAMIGQLQLLTSDIKLTEYENVQVKAMRN
jgi:PIN domain nuclease of toxin-antitoxin system